jgi:putative ABC transport system permease protein
MLESYLKIALKILGRRKFFTFVSLFGISVTLAVLIVASALLDQAFAAQAPESRAGRLLGIYKVSMRGEGNRETSEAGYKLLDRYVRPMASLPQVEAFSIAGRPHTVASYLGGRKIESQLKRTDGEFWRIVDFRFLEGGPFTSADEANGNFVAVINETTRRRFFGGAPALGRTLEADGQRFRVVGVVPDVPVLRFVSYADLWVPISTAKSSSYRDELLGDFNGLILARRRADFPRLKAEFDAHRQEAERHLPDPKSYNRLVIGADTHFEAIARNLMPIDEEDSGARLMAALLSLAALLFMLLPTVNLVNLNLSRILDRASEIGVRKAFGASSRTLVGQFLLENVVLTLIGALIGLALAGGVLHALNQSGLVPYAHFTLNYRVFFYGLAAALFFGCLSGVYPAWRMSRLHPVQALRGRTA